MLEETGIPLVVDPLAGSFYIEWLTNRAEEEILREMDAIWGMGGIVKAIEAGWLHQKIAECSYNEYKMVQEGVIRVVGVNHAPAEKVELPPIDVFRYPEDAEMKQVKRLEEVKRMRDNETVKDKLEKIREAALRGENLFPYILMAVRERATEGELFDVFKEVFGTWTPLIRI